MCHQVNCGYGQHFRQAPYCGWYHHRVRCSPVCAWRSFPTREETIEELEEYLKQLKAEAKGVEDRITELRKED